MAARVVFCLALGLFAGLAGAAQAGQAAVRPSLNPVPVKKPDTQVKPGAECAWVGKRIIGLLVREDVVAAGEFMRFHSAFACSDAHLGRAFACVVEEGDEKDSGKPQNERINDCWADPETGTHADGSP